MPLNVGFSYLCLRPSVFPSDFSFQWSAPFPPPIIVGKMVVAGFVGLLKNDCNTDGRLLRLMVVLALEYTC